MKRYKLKFKAHDNVLDDKKKIKAFMQAKGFIPLFDDSITEKSVKRELELCLRGSFRVKIEGTKVTISSPDYSADSLWDEISAGVIFGPEAAGWMSSHSDEDFVTLVTSKMAVHFNENQLYENKETGVHFEVNPGHRWVNKVLVHKGLNGAGRYIKMDNDELKFFDNLNYTITPLVSDLSGQTIEDWFWKKANDSLSQNQLQYKIRQFLRQEYPEVKMRGAVGSNIVTFVLSESTTNDGDEVELIIEVNFTNRTIEQWYVTESGHATDACGFQNNEMKFFDDLGFTGEPFWASKSEQDIADWFWNRKASDGSDNRMELLEQALQHIGYGSAVKEPDGNTTFTFKENPDVFIRRITNVFYQVNKMSNYMKFEKLDKDNNVKFTNQELRILDTLDFELHSIYAPIGNEDDGLYSQNVDDWFGKAEDSITDTIDGFMNKCGYKREEDGDRILRYFKGDVKKGTMYEITVYLEGKSISKEAVEEIDELNNIVGDFTLFDRDELKFFDDLGFNMESVFRKNTGQDIGDWFWEVGNKAQDAVNINEAIKKFYTARGYVRDDRIETKDQSAYNLITGDNTKYQVVIQPILKKVYKSYTSDIKRFTTKYTQFDKAELKFFDDLGFDLSSGHQAATGQHIDDWFWKGKAQDVLTPDDIVKRIRWFLIKIYPEADVENDAESTLFILDIPNRKGEFRVIEVNFDDMTIEKWSCQDSQYTAALKFSDDELRFFDNLNFTGDKEWTVLTKQDINDWF